MKSPRWGIANVVPDDATAYWGARGTLRGEVIDIPFDRQEWAGDSEDEEQLLADWMYDIGWHRVETLAENLKGNSPEIKHIDCGMYHIRISIQASYGHVFITAWKDKE